MFLNKFIFMDTLLVKSHPLNNIEESIALLYLFCFKFRFYFRQTLKTVNLSLIFVTLRDVAFYKWNLTEISKAIYGNVKFILDIYLLEYRLVFDNDTYILQDKYPSLLSKVDMRSNSLHVTAKRKENQQQHASTKKSLKAQEITLST